MKTDKLDDNQLSLFDVIDGGNQKDTKNENILKFNQRQLIDVKYSSCDDMFSGFNKIQAITYSFDLNFINHILKYFDYAEIILGAKFIADNDNALYKAFIHANDVKDGSLKNKRVINMLKDGSLTIKVPQDIIDHRKLYILSSDDGRTRVIFPSANSSYNAWNGSHNENYDFDDSEYGYTNALEDFNTAWDLAEEMPYSCIAAKPTSDNDDDVINNNPIINKIKQTNQAIILREDTSKEAVEFSKYCISYQNDMKKCKELLKGIDLKSDKGITMISAKEIKKIESHMKRNIRQKKLKLTPEERTTDYPKLVIDYFAETAYMNDQELDLDPSEKEIKNDIDELLKIFDNFKTFINGEKNLQPNHFKLLNAVFCSPFIAKLRCEAFLNKVGTSSLPLFMLISSANPNCGKTFMVTAILKMMTGQTLEVETGIEIKKDILKYIQYTRQGTPIFIDEINGKYLSEKEDYIKNPEQCERQQLDKMPLVIFASNNVISLEEKYRKRMMFISYDGAMPSNIDQSEYKSKGIAIINRLGNALYRAYLKKMIPQINSMIHYMDDIENREDGYYPDIMALSSKTIIDIITEYGYSIPKYMKPLSWNDAYSVNAISVSDSFLDEINQLFITNRKSFTINTSANLVTIELANTPPVEKMFESWKRSLPNEIQAKVVPTRDLCSIHFQKDKLEEFLGHSLSTGFLSFLHRRTRDRSQL